MIRFEKWKALIIAIIHIRSRSTSQERGGEQGARVAGQGPRNRRLLK